MVCVCFFLCFFAGGLSSLILFCGLHVQAITWNRKKRVVVDLYVCSIVGRSTGLFIRWIFGLKPCQNTDSHYIIELMACYTHTEENVNIGQDGWWEPCQHSTEKPETCVTQYQEYPTQIYFVSTVWSVVFSNLTFLTLVIRLSKRKLPSWFS